MTKTGRVHYGKVGFDENTVSEGRFTSGIKGRGEDYLVVFNGRGNSPPFPSYVQQMLF